MSSAGAEASADRRVPLFDEFPASFFTASPTTRFEIRRCGEWATDLWFAARAAASQWNAVTGEIPRIEIQRAGCFEVSPLDERNVVHFVPSHEGDLGALWRATHDDEGIIQQDVQVARDFIEEKVAEGHELRRILERVLVHEFGHALGLGDTYETHPGECGWSVMLAICPSLPAMDPTHHDLDALRRIYDVPDQGGSGVSQFDRNGNGFIDDPEFFNAVDTWLADEISDGVFFDVVDLWINDAPIDGQSAGFKLADAQRVTVYDLSGNSVERWKWNGGDRLARWRQRAPAGTYVVRACEGESCTLKRIGVTP